MALDLLQCAECYHLVREDDIDDPFRDECPHCGEHTFFYEVEGFGSDHLDHLDNLDDFHEYDPDTHESGWVCRKCGEPPEGDFEFDYHECEFCGFAGRLQENGT
jgi:DNA-directed RNA polymerase subunit RPC12/RpoP